jgi:hypothetical protein
MSEPMGMDIQIGGDLPQNLIEDFLGLLNDLADVTGPCTEKELRAWSGNGKKPITWYAVPHYGECDEVKEFCREHKLGYIHHIEAMYEYDAELHYWVPGMKEEKDLESNQDADQMIAVDKIRPICDLLLAYSQQGPKCLPLFLNTPGLEKIAEAGLKRPSRALKKIEKEINNLMPVEPKLPPFIIV